MPKDVVARYLAEYAEKEHTIEIAGQFAHAIVIPAYGEASEIIETLMSIPTSPLGPVLVILVLNAPQSAPSDMLEANRKLSKQLELLITPHHIELIHRWKKTEERLPDKEGVGLARKIGSDLALSLMHRDIIVPGWIHQTDADVLLPPDYFTQTDPCDADLFIYPFEHQMCGDPKLDRAMALYDKRIRQYVDGLRFAGSPYAFPTIGSILAVNHEAYAKVRGFPKLAAGEDFYLVNKLAKIGSVVCGNGNPIQIQNRRSKRVPFGTSQHVMAIADESQNESGVLYDQQLFIWLKEWLDFVAAQIHDPSSWKQLAQQTLASKLFVALEELGTFEGLKHLETHNNLERRLSAFHVWFDALKTLRLINRLR